MNAPETGGTTPASIAEPQFPQREAGNLREEMTVVTGLGGLAAISYAAEQTGWIRHHLESPLKEIGNSMAHPGIGYIGALALSYAFRSSSIETGRARFVLLAGTVADVAVERAQDIIMGGVDSTDSFLAPAHLRESAKDYAFALGGAMLFWAHRKWSVRRQARQPQTRDAETIRQLLQPNES